jgi:hypothetical protein
MLRLFQSMLGAFRSMLGKIGGYDEDTQGKRLGVFVWYIRWGVNPGAGPKGRGAGLKTPVMGPEQISRC